MKQLIALSALTFATLGFVSCEKSKEGTEFQKIESQVSVQVTVPVVANTSAESSLSLNSLKYNIDSVIKANTDNKYSSKDVESIYINDLQINLLDADASNNLANFENVKLLINNSTSPVIIGSATIPDNYATRVSLQVSNNNELKAFLKDNYLDFSLSGKARRATNRTVQAVISATFKLDKS